MERRKQTTTVKRLGKETKDKDRNRRRREFGQYTARSASLCIIDVLNVLLQQAQPLASLSK